VAARIRTAPTSANGKRSGPGAVAPTSRTWLNTPNFTVVTDEMQTYRCGGCGASDTALAPDQLVPGGRYDSSIAINIAVDKSADHQPLNRQVATMKRAGLKVSRQTLWDQLNALATLCEPSYLALHDWMLKSHDLLHADETTWRMMVKGGAAKWWLWAIAAHDGFFCSVSPTRSAKAARGLLRDFDGSLMTRRSGYVPFPDGIERREDGSLDITLGIAEPSRLRAD
jgi:hypothetical protein